MELDVIYNEDCYEGIKRIPDKSIDLVYVDVPYDLEGNDNNRDYEKEYNDSLNSNSISYLDKAHRKSTNEFKHIAFGFDFKLLDEFVRVLKNIYIYIWCSKKQILPLMKYFVEDRKCHFDIITWHKTNPVPSCNLYHNDTEYCLVFRDSKATKNNGNYFSKFKYFVSGLNAKDKSLYNHPTIKPVEFVKQHILNSTDENDIVLDTFMGSGTTAVACKETNRHYIGFEISKEYYDIAMDRLDGVTQKEKNSEFKTEELW